ncbi:uncharacterized protein A1O5_03213 [Cladophialophora psammophila CBS 110553]|uniref:Purple acid phosphatase n=1 Tax=Cladophialophora psammophila CBS 110553 TaxID=1182543 RepID=W9WZU9_9EURO|nr:uncharacterized protein A1O5_03213 [Cladophialophora psammophila CBS 110553]EXJ73453.1 hypothetical protein A1O5_03213 [Cladophialophora psammophila CBS 110553]
MLCFVYAGLLAAGVVQLAHAATNNTINSQLRLAYAGDTGMYVSWNTFEKLARPTVHYGLLPNHLNMTASSNVSVTYPTSLTYNNHVKITGLKPDTLYYYLPEHLLHMNSHCPYTFITGRPAGNPAEFSVAVVVDLGTMGSQGLTTYAGKGVSENNTLSPGEINTIQSLEKFKGGYDFVWHPGDIAYADYWLKEEIQGFLPNTTIAQGFHVYESILNDFYDEFTPITAYKPYMVGPGNHEANCDNGGYTDKYHNITYDVSICIPGQTNFTGYRNHFRMPSAESGGTGNFWYSFDHGMTHFVQVDTETDLGHGFVAPDEPGGVEGEDSGPFNTTIDAQTKWLEADLASVNRTATPWVIVAGHRPWYLSNANDSGTICWTCKDVFEPLYIKYGVDLVLSGHAHVYERQNPLANGIMDPAGLNNPKAPWYITNGAAGHYDGLDNLQYPLMDYSRFGLDTLNKTYGWSKLTFHNSTHMTHEFVASKSGEVLDLATLYKARK